MNKRHWNNKGEIWKMKLNKLERKWLTLGWTFKKIRMTKSSN